MTIDLDYAAEPSARSPRPVPRSWGAALVAAVVLLLTGASNPVQARETARITVGDHGTFALDGDTLYTMRDDGVTAYAAPSGPRRWTAAGERVDREAGYGAVTVLSSSACGTSSTNDTVAHTVAHDRRTGRVLWQRDASTLPVAAGNPLVVTLSGGPSDRCMAPRGDFALDGTLRIAALVPTTGAVAWQTSLPRGTGIAVDLAAPTWMAVVDPKGALSVLDLRTGVRSATFQTLQTRSLRMTALGDVLVAAQLTYPGPRQVLRWVTGSIGSDGVSTATVIVDGDSPISADIAGGDLEPPQVAFTAFDRRRATELWKATVAAGTAAFVSQRCGDDLCVVGDQTFAVNLTDGKVDWTASPAAYADLGAGRLMLEPSVDTRAGLVGITLADPRTGHQVLHLPTWRPVAVDGARSLIAQARADDGRTLLAWLDGTRPAPFDAVSGKIEYGALSGPSFAFQSAGEVHLLKVG